MDLNKAQTWRVSVLIVLKFLCSCTNKKIEMPAGCSEIYLAEKGMIPYTGQDIGCRFFLERYEWNRKEYFLLANACMDFVAYPTDCDGNQLCTVDEDAECRAFFNEATYKGIVGIKE